MVIGPIPFSEPLYYCMIIVLAAMGLFQPTGKCNMAIVFLIACALSIFVGNPPAFFKPWLRLGLFTLVILAVFPVFSNPKLTRYRRTLLYYSIGICTFIGVTGVLCYLAGINYMAILRDETRDIDTVGWFGGLAPHSMMLGPCGAIGTVTMAWLALRTSKPTFYKILFWVASFMSFLSTLLSASRSASIASIVGFALLLFIKNKGKIHKFIGIGIVLAGLLIATFPYYEKFAAPVLTKQQNNELAGGSTFSSREDRWNHRLEEFESSPVFGIGFASLSTDAIGEYVEDTGGVEPGSSWLAILSMTGIVGGLSFILILFPTFFKLYREAIHSPSGSIPMLVASLIGVFAVTMCAEGYILAGGSFFCYFIWLLLGVGYSETHPLSRPVQKLA